MTEQLKPVCKPDCEWNTAFFRQVAKDGHTIEQLENQLTQARGMAKLWKQCAKILFERADFWEYHSRLNTKKFNKAEHQVKELEKLMNEIREKQMAAAVALHVKAEQQIEELEKENEGLRCCGNCADSSKKWVGIGCILHCNSDARNEAVQLDEESDGVDFEDPIDPQDVCSHWQSKQNEPEQNRKGR